MKTQLLLLSNSTNFGEAYLQWPIQNIADFLNAKVTEVLFIPYAGLTISYDEYTAKVASAFNGIGYNVKGIHTFTNPKLAVENAQAIAVGGGNTFHLLRELYDNDLIDAIRLKIKEGTPYMGWSAGSNVAAPTICTTNDMPVVEPPTFNALKLVPFQLNPHFTDKTILNHGGETRRQRLQEYLVANPQKTVLGIDEGCFLQQNGRILTYVGNANLKVFKFQQDVVELNEGDVSHLLA